MKDFYELIKELIEHFKLSPKTIRWIKLGFLILTISVAFLTIKNNFFNNEADDTYETNVNENNSEKTIINTGNNNKIIQDNSNKYFIKNDTNTIEAIEEYLNNPDTYYDYYIIKKEGYKPYFIIAYYKSDSLCFESFKIINDKVNIINSLKVRALEFDVSSWTFEPISVGTWDIGPSMLNKYLLFTGCKPHSCDSEFGMYVYSLKYNEGYAISTKDTISFTVYNLPKKSEVMCDFENIILRNRPELINMVQVKGSIFDFLPSRKLPNLLDSVEIKDKILSRIKESLKETLKDSILILLYEDKN